MDTSLYKLNPRAFSVLSGAYYMMPEIASKAIDAIGSPKQAILENQLIKVGSMWEQIMSMVTLNGDGTAIIALTGDVTVINALVSCLREAAGLNVLSQIAGPLETITVNTEDDFPLIARNGLTLTGFVLEWGGLMIEQITEFYGQNGDEAIYFHNIGPFTISTAIAGGVNLNNGSSYFHLVNNTIDSHTTFGTTFTSTNAITLSTPGNFIYITAADFQISGGAGNITSNPGLLKLNSVLPDPLLLYDTFFAADMTWHVPDSLWNGGGWASIEGGSGLYAFDGPTMIYGGSPLAGNAAGFSFYTNSTVSPKATFHVVGGGTNPNEQGVAANTYDSFPIQFRSSGQLRLWHDKTISTIDLAGNVSGSIAPKISLAGATAPNPTDYIAGDGTWKTIPGGGGAYTSDNGLTLTSTNFQLGGPLVKNTLINGAGFDMIFGTFLTSPIDQFEVYGTTYLFNARNAGTGEQSSLTMNSGTFNVGMTGAGSMLLTAGTSTPFSATTANILTLRRRTSVTNAPGLVTGYDIQVNAAPSAGFGMYDQWSMHNASNASAIAQQELLTWSVVTAGAESSTWERKLRQAGAILSVHTIETNPRLLHTLKGDVQFADASGRVGFFTTTPVVKQTGSALTNNVTASGTTDQFDNWVDLTDYATDAVAIHNTVSQIARKLTQINDGLRLYGLFT